MTKNFASNAKFLAVCEKRMNDLGMSCEQKIYELFGYY
jgi:hypothetical protein